MKFHIDNRGQRLFDIFELSQGQINVTYVSSTKHIVAWHKHEKQIDYWACLKGSFQVGLASPTEDDPEKYIIDFEYLTEKDPTRTLIIYPGIYHGYRALEPNSIILYYLTEKYNRKDHFYEKPGAFGEDWSTPNK